MDTQKIVQILRNQLEKVVRGQANSMFPTFISDKEVNSVITMSWVSMSKQEFLFSNVQETRIKAIENLVTGKCRY